MGSVKVNTDEAVYVYPASTVASLGGYALLQAQYDAPYTLTEHTESVQVPVHAPLLKVSAPGTAT